MDQSRPGRIPGLENFPFDLGDFIPDTDEIVVTARKTFCRAVSYIGPNDRLRFGADGALGYLGVLRGGTGVSVDNTGTVYWDGHFGGGVGAAFVGAAGLSYQFNPPTGSRATLTAQAGGGIGLIGGEVQAGGALSEAANGDLNGSMTAGGQVNIGFPAPVPTGGRVGLEASVAANGQIVSQLGRVNC